MIIETKKLKDLKPAPYNPRKSTERQEGNLKASLEKFGVVEPIIFNKQTGYIVGGHFRVRELKKLGFKDVECVIVDLNEADEKELNIRLNANTGEWDMDALATEWDKEQLEEWGLDLPSFDEEENVLEAKEDDYQEPSNLQVDVVLGDLIEIGVHRLLCGDSTDSDCVAKVMGNEKADMVFTDPPYGMNLDTDYSEMQDDDNTFGKKESKKYDKVIGDNEDFKPELINTIFACFYDVKEVFIWGADYFAELIPEKNKGSWIVWDKRENADGASNLDKMFGSSFELCWSKEKHKREICRVRWAALFGTEKEHDKKRVHPTQKPSLLAQWFFNKWGNVGDLIADLFLGSGSTMVAAHQLNRKCYGMELDPKYCQVIINRMQKLDPNLKIKINGVLYEPKTEKVPF
jgi:DNA modification methylase